MLHHSIRKHVKAALWQAREALFLITVELGDAGTTMYLVFSYSGSDAAVPWLFYAILLLKLFLFVPFFQVPSVSHSLAACHRSSLLAEAEAAPGRVFCCEMGGHVRFPHGPAVSDHQCRGACLRRQS